MESSTVLAFRIFVMLSCLIIVPLAAIFGSAFPDVVKSVLVDRIVALGTGKSATPSVDAAAPGALPGSAQAAEHSAPPTSWNAAPAPRWPAQEGQPLENGAPPAWQNGGVVPAVAANVPQQTGNQSASFAAPAEANHGQMIYPSQQAAVEMPGRLPPTDANASAVRPAGYPANVAPPAGDAGRVSPRPLDQPDPFTAMERKLREYGATYYLLETWGSGGDLYRFHCRMSVSSNPNYTRHFEATDRDALQAMSQVLSRVEAWRAGRLQ